MYKLNNKYTVNIFLIIVTFSHYFKLPVLECVQYPTFNHYYGPLLRIKYDLFLLSGEEV